MKTLEITMVILIPEVAGKNPSRRMWKSSGRQTVPWPTSQSSKKAKMPINFHISDVDKNWW